MSYLFFCRLHHLLCESPTSFDVERSGQVGRGLEELQERYSVGGGVTKWLGNPKITERFLYRSEFVSSICSIPGDPRPGKVALHGFLPGDRIVLAPDHPESLGKVVGMIVNTVK
eukprot:IDg12980t1